MTKSGPVVEIYVELTEIGEVLRLADIESKYITLQLFHVNVNAFQITSNTIVCSTPCTGYQKILKFRKY